MLSSDMLDPELWKAYRETTYWVETPDRYFPIRIDQRHPELDRFLAPFGDGEWAFLTACNPRSQLLSPAENRQRTTELEALLEGTPHWPGLGAGTGDWFPEASVCVVMRWDRALALAERFEQLAIVVGRQGEPARLLILPRGSAADFAKPDLAGGSGGGEDGIA